MQQIFILVWLLVSYHCVEAFSNGWPRVVVGEHNPCSRQPRNRSHQRSHRSERNVKNKCKTQNDPRHKWNMNVGNLISSECLALVFFVGTIFTPSSLLLGDNEKGAFAWAAPPIAVIAEELGYFPVRNTNGDIVYIPKHVQRPSTPQAIELAKYMRQNNIYMAGTYWCPHTNRQRELFGEQAWNELQYVECSAKGYRGQPELCIRKRVDGYPTWIFGSTGKTLPGERPLSEIVREVGFPGAWDDALEESSSPPPPIGGAACK